MSNWILCSLFVYARLGGGGDKSKKVCVYDFACSPYWRKPGRGIPLAVKTRLTATSVIRSPRYYGYYFLAARQNGHTFSCKKYLVITAIFLAH